MAEEASPRAVFGMRYPAEMRAVHIRNAIVMREPFVHEGIVSRSAGPSRFDRHSLCSRRRAMFRDERPAADCRQSRETVSDRASRAARLRRYSHCSAKLSTSAFERSSASIRRTCCSRTPRRPELATDRQVEQLIVRNAAPEKERKTRRQFDIGDLIRAFRGTAVAGRARSGTGNPGLPGWLAAPSRCLPRTSRLLRGRLDSIGAASLDPHRQAAVGRRVALAYR